MPPRRHKPIREKRSLAIHGHQTSISLEPEFWAVIDEAIYATGLTFAKFITQLDDDRTESDQAYGLAGYLRLWALRRVLSTRGWPK